MVSSARDVRALPGMADAAQQRQRLPQRSPLHARARRSADRRGLRELHRPADRRTALLRREHRQHARRHARRASRCPRRFSTASSQGIAGAQYDDPEKMPLWRPFAKFPHAVPESQRARLAAAGKAALADAVIPAYASVPALFRGRVSAGGASDDRRLGVSRGPGVLRRPRPLFHDASRCDARGHPRDRRRRGGAHPRGDGSDPARSSNHGGDLAGFFEFLRTDPQFRPRTGEELLREAAWIAKEIDGKLPAFSASCRACPTRSSPCPDALAPNYTTGRYNPGPLGAAGEYWVNTYAPETRLTLHAAGVDAARGGAGTSSADRALPRAHRPAGHSGSISSRMRSAKAGRSTARNSARKWGSITRPINASAA